MGSQDDDAEEILWSMHVLSKKAVLPAALLATGFFGLAVAENSIPEFDFRDFTTVHYLEAGAFLTAISIFLWWFSRETYASQQIVKGRQADEYFEDTDTH